MNYNSTGLFGDPH